MAIFSRFGRALLAAVASGALASCQAAPLPPQGAEAPVIITSASPSDGVSREMISGPATPNVEDAEVASPTFSSASKKTSLRLAAVAQAAVKYGAQAGLAYTTRQIDISLHHEAPNLDREWDVQTMLITGPAGTRILPPVIVSEHHIYRQKGERVVVIADRSYRILSPARFVPVAPLWQTYLLRPWSSPAAPDSGLYPKSAAERSAWRHGVLSGWGAGRDQALAIFWADLHRLERDYLGMIRWSRLVAEGKATAPVVAATMQGVTGNAQQVTIDRGVVRLTAPARLQVNPDDWRSPSYAVPPVVQTPVP